MPSRYTVLPIQTEQQNNTYLVRTTVIEVDQCFFPFSTFNLVLTLTQWFFNISQQYNLP